MDCDSINNLVHIEKVSYGNFGGYNSITYPKGFTNNNSNVIIIDCDEFKLGTCAYSLSPDKSYFKGTRLNGSILESNYAFLLFIKNKY